VSAKLRIAYFAHSLRSDWNNGNAHFLRGLMRGLRKLGHEPVVFAHRDEWSVRTLCLAASGEEAFDRFAAEYSDLQTYLYDARESGQHDSVRQLLEEFDVVILHEWNPQALAHTLRAA
jgi:spore maturation protein CgeB